MRGGGGLGRGAVARRGKNERAGGQKEGSSGRRGSKGDMGLQGWLLGARRRCDDWSWRSTIAIRAGRLSKHLPMSKPDWRVLFKAARTQESSTVQQSEPQSLIASERGYGDVQKSQRAVVLMSPRCRREAMVGY
jgi:hypothetical protein